MIKVLMQEPLIEQNDKIHEDYQEFYHRCTKFAFQFHKQQMGIVRLQGL